MHCLRLGISTGTYGLILTNLMNDIIMGAPQITMDPVGLGVIDPEYVNIMITGHQQAMFNNLQESLEKETIQRSAKLVGAKGIRIVGCTCGGLENCGLMTMDAVDLAGPGLQEVCRSLGVPPVLNFGPCLAIGRIEMAACALAETMGVDLPQLPVVISAPQWLEEQALADGAYALAL